MNSENEKPYTSGFNKSWSTEQLTKPLSEASGFRPVNFTTYANSSIKDSFPATNANFTSASNKLILII